jgi:thioredoxin-related protein
MRLLIVLLSCFLFSFTHAQKTAEDSLDASLRKKGIPSFDLLKADSASHLTKADILPKHKTLIMFFSPDCSHCQHQTEDMIAGMDSLKDVQIVMATYQPFETMVAFSQKYEIEKYSNIKMGRDVNYFFPPFYKMKSLPHLALYDDKGVYITGFEGNQKVATLVEAFAKGVKK